ncbi:MAG: methionine gamma-lyase family protein, partial [Clostridiales bacterium]
MNRNQVEKAAKEAWERMETYTPLANIITEKNVNRVLDSFRRQMVGEHHFYPSSGYGYDDSGRDKLEE